MKKILVSLSLMISFTFVYAQSKFSNKKVESVKKTEIVTKKELSTPNGSSETVAKKDDIAKSTIDFVSKVIDYGKIEHNSDGVRQFIFTNNGSEPLLIKNAKGSCGCTVPSYPKEPIAPGVTAEIGVKYATTRVGKFTKTITLTTNADKKPVILTIKGEVGPAPAVNDDNPLERKKEGSPLERK